MARYEVSRTLVKSPPELWTELEGERLSEIADGVKVTAIEAERTLAWEATGLRGTATLEPSGWGTRLTLTADVEEDVATLGLWARLRGQRPPPSQHPDVEERLEAMLESLGTAHRKPFSLG